MKSLKISGLLALAFAVSLSSSFSHAAVGGGTYNKAKPKQILATNKATRTTKALVRNADEMLFYADPNTNNGGAAKEARVKETCPFKTSGTAFERVNTNSGSAPKSQPATTTIDNSRGA